MELVSFEVNGDGINLFSLPSEKIDALKDYTLFDFSEEINNLTTNDIENGILNQDFCERSTVEKIIPQSIVLSENLDQALRQNLAMDSDQGQGFVDEPTEEIKALKGIAPKDPQLDNALSVVKTVSMVLNKLLLKNSHFSIEELEFTADAKRSFSTQTGISAWVADIKNTAALRNTVFSQYNAEEHEAFSKYQLNNLSAFSCMLEEIRKFGSSNNLIMFFNKHDSQTKSDFIAAVENLSAVTMLLCIVALAIKEQMELVQQNILSESNPAWNDYQDGVTFFNAYVLAHQSSLSDISISEEIKCVLPALDTSMAILVGDTELKEQALTVAIKLSANNHMMVYLQSADQKLFSPWHIIRPEQLSPDCNIALYSPLTVLAAYKKEVEENSLGIKNIGAEHECNQLERIKNEEFYSKDKSLLIGFYGLLYITARLNVSGFDKAESRSRMAQSLAMMGREELGVDFDQFYKIYDKHLRPQAYGSSKVTGKPAPQKTESILHAMRLVLQMAVLKFKHLLINTGLDPNTKLPFYTNFQLEFGSRGNGPQQLLNVLEIVKKRSPKLISELEAKKDFTTNKLLSSLGQLETIVVSLPDRITDFLHNTHSNKMIVQANSLTVLQKMKLAFVIEVEFYHAMFAKNKETKEIAKIFAYLQEQTNLACARQPANLGVILGGEFLLAQNFFNETDMSAIKSPRLKDNQAILRNEATPGFFVQAVAMSKNDEALLQNLLDNTPK